MLQFENAQTAAAYEALTEVDFSVIVLQLQPAYRGRLSKATPEAVAQMIAEGVPFVRQKQED